MLRQRHTTKDPLTIVRQLDAFPKIPDEYKVGTCIGGLLSLVSRLLILLMVYHEFQLWWESELTFKFQPDHHMDDKLRLHIDMTVATPCKAIGADIMDQTSQNVFSFGTLQEEDTWWEMCPRQREHFEFVQAMNTYLREEWHSLTHLVFKEISSNPLQSLQVHHSNTPPRRTDAPKRPHDACRLHGELTLNKVSGNFHVVAGKAMQFQRGHVHIGPMFADDRMNFSHRIHRFGFGDPKLGLMNPLEGDEKVITQAQTSAQYFVEVVPTEIRTLWSTVLTYQYSVKENIRPVDHSRGSHGIPGLYFKYDIAALRISVQPNREHVLHFVVRVGAIIGGVVVISGLLNALLQNGALAVQRLWHPEDERLRRMSAAPVQVGAAAACNLLLSGAKEPDVVVPVPAAVVVPVGDGMGAKMAAAGGLAKSM